MTDIKAGDVVYLASGSDPMTVSETYNANGKQMAICVWQDQKGEHKSSSYNLAALKQA